MTAQQLPGSKQRVEPSNEGSRSGELLTSEQRIASAKHPILDDLVLAEWVKQTCLLFGTTAQTAYQVAGLFIEALHHER